MGECSSCGRDLPRFEQLCPQCYAARYVELTASKGSLSPRFFRAPAVITGRIGTPKDSREPEANTSLSNYGRSAYMYLLLWIFGEAIVGVFFYALFTYMPDFVKIIVCGAAMIIWYDYRYFRKRTGKIYAGPLFLLPLIFALFCLVMWKITGEDVWGRLVIACECVQAVYIVFDRTRRPGF